MDASPTVMSTTAATTVVVHDTLDAELMGEIDQAGPNAADDGSAHEEELDSDGNDDPRESGKDGSDVDMQDVSETGLDSVANLFEGELAQE